MARPIFILGALVVAGVLAWLLLREPAPAGTHDQAGPPGREARRPGSDAGAATERPGEPGAPITSVPFPREPEAKGHRLQGLLVEAATGRPVSGVAIRVLRPGPDSVPVDLEPTDALGRFKTRELLPSGPISLHVRERFSPVPGPGLPIGHLELGRDASTDLRLLYPLVGAVTVRAMDAEGRPVPRAAVSIRSPDAEPGPGVMPIRAGETDPDGVLRIDGLHPERLIVISASAEGLLPGTSGMVQPRAAPAAPEIEILLAAPAGLVLGGVVVDDEDRPLPRAVVVAEAVKTASGLIGPPAQVATDSEGRFLIATLQPGQYRVVAARGAFERSAPLVIDAGRKDVRLVIPKPRSGFRLRVLDDATGLPIENADAIIAGELLTSMTTTDARGEAVSPATEGTYQVIAGFRGLVPQVRTVSVVAAEEGQKLIEFRLAAGRRVTGQVVDRERQPVAGAKVTVIVERRFALPSMIVESGADGGFVLDGLPFEGGEVGVIDGHAVRISAPASAETIVLRVP